jgi:hypothetical protein
MSMRVGIQPPKWMCVALAFALAIGLTAPVSAQQSTPAPAKPASGKELIAVLDLDAVGSSKTEASAMTDRLREELLKTGKFTLVDRQQMEAVLGEQAFQQAGCTSAECAVKVGKVLGARKLVTGRVTKIDEQHWLLSANIIDVETAETLRSESLPHEGAYFSMLVSGIHTLALRLTGDQAGPRAEPAVPAAVVVAPPPPQPAAEEKPPEKKGVSGWVWVLVGVLVVGAAVYASQPTPKKSTAASTPAGPTCSSASGCGTVTATW